MTDQRNLLLAIILSVIILFGFQMMFGMPQQKRQPTPAAVEQEAPPVATAKAPPTSEALPLPGAPAAPQAARAGALSETPRVAINPDDGSATLTGSIALRGGHIDDVVLNRYHETVEPDSPRIVLLSPPGAPHPYYADFGWVADPDAKAALPGADTLWQSDRRTLGPGQPVTLRWDNGEGLRFERRITLDENYMFTVVQKVENYGKTPVALYPYGLISRTDEPPTLGYYILHEGPLGVFDDTLKEVDYDDLRETPTVTVDSVGGWLGITDKFWLAALIPDQKARITGHFRYMPSSAGRDKFQVDYLLDRRRVGPGEAMTVTNRLFAGAKEVTLLDGYEQALGIARFDLAVDFGWFYFLTKPLFYLLHYMGRHLGNVGLAILALTVLIKLLFFPLANKSYVAMSKLKALQPEMVKMRERFGDDKVRLNKEMMALYKREKANPLAGCLPIVIQIPVFFALYKVLFVTLEMRQAPFYGWILDLSARDPTNLFNLFGLLPWTPPDFLWIGVWPLIMGTTMWLQQKLNPSPPDPVQARIMMLLPIVFTFLFARFPAGLVIYWTWNNTLSILQQWVIMRRMGVKT